jgi:hypothetical protein
VSDSFQFPWNVEPQPSVPPPGPGSQPEPETGEAKRKRRGRRPASLTRTALLTRTTAPDWLYHRLTISGPADYVEQFAAAARGAGVVPWRLDGADIEDTVFNLAVAQPTRGQKLTVEGCRILARQFRDRVEAHQARVVAQIGRSRACPFDLHTLLPVPADILQLGPTHPAALAWLAAHWGVTDRLRQVSVRANATTGRRLPRGHSVISYGFFTAGDAPDAAIALLAARWPALRFGLVPRPAD